MEYCTVCSKPIGKQITSGAFFNYCSLPCLAFGLRYITLAITLVFVVWLSFSPDVIPALGALIFSFLAIYGLSVKINKIDPTENNSLSDQELSDSENSSSSKED